MTGTRTESLFCMIYVVLVCWSIYYVDELNLPDKKSIYINFQQFSSVCLKARLHRRFLWRQLDAIFVAPKLHQVSNMFETPEISRRQIALKIVPGLHVRFWSCNLEHDKNCIELLRQKSPVCKWAFTNEVQGSIIIIALFWVLRPFCITCALL